jgi:hypothetical protein
VADDGEPSPGKLFIDAFLEKNLVSFDKCRTHYERMTPDELVFETSFLFSKPTMSIPFAFTFDRYCAFFDSLVRCAASFRDLTRDQRTLLVNMAIDVRDYVRSRAREDQRQKLDDWLNATLDYFKKFGMYPTVGDLIGNGERNYSGVFPSNPVGEMLAERDGTHIVPSHLVPSLIFDEGPQGAETVSAYLRATGDTAHLENAGWSLLRQSGAIGDDNKVDLQKLTAWENRYKGALSMLPGFQRKLERLRQSREKLDSFRRSPAMLFIDNDPATATRKLFALPDTTSAMRILVDMTNDPAHPEPQKTIGGMQKAVVNYIRDEVGVTDDKATEFLEFFRKHEQALAILFDAEKMQTLKGIAADLERSQLVRTMAKAPLIAAPITQEMQENTPRGIMSFLRRKVGRRKNPPAR